MRGTLREKRPGVWELRVRTGRDPLTGRYGQVSRTVHGGKRQAEADLARLSAEVAEGRHSATGQKVSQLFDASVAQLEAQGRTPKTIDGWKSLIRSRLGPGLGHLELRKLTPAHLDSFYRALLKDGLSRTSVHHCHAALSMALRQAVKWGWIDRSPADRASPPSVPTQEIVPPSAERLVALIAELDRTDHDLASMVFVAATTGCRRGELCGLRWSDIDLAGGSLTVRRSITDTSQGVTEKDPKTHRSRRLSLDSATVTALTVQRDRMVTRAAAVGVPLAADAYVWSQDPTCAVPYRPNRVTDGFRTVRRRLGFDDLDFHHLRHFAATTLAGAGVDIRTIAGRLGHANPSVTLKTYAHFLEASDRQAAEVMGRIGLRSTPASEG